MQSGDLKTFLSLQATNKELPEIKYRSAHDLTEIETLQQSQGLGIELYDDGSRDFDEFAAVADELGVPIPRESR